MKKLFGNAVVGQSGGPTAAINATLSGVIRGALEATGNIGTLYGMRNGIEGMLRGDLVDLSAIFPSGKGLELLEQTPAAYLGSCRKKLPDPASDPDFYKSLFEVLHKFDIRYFFYIGGNDSMDTVRKLSDYCRASGEELIVTGVPKTIDNDLVATDHTPGFGSAAKYIAVTTQEILRDCAVYTVPAVTVIELMGRDAGWLTAASALGRLVNGREPDLVYLPERTFSMESFFSDVRKALEKHPNVVVAVSEGLRFADGHYVGEGTQSGARDIFGHSYLAGTGKALEHAIKAEIGCKVRSVEINLPQRCGAHVASLTDIRESVAVGKEAVRVAASGVTGQMMTFLRAEGREYRCTVSHESVSGIANLVRSVPDEFINEAGNHVTDACLEWMLPLIRGEVPTVWENGLPKHLTLN